MVLHIPLTFNEARGISAIISALKLLPETLLAVTSPGFSILSILILPKPEMLTKASKYMYTVTGCYRATSVM